jgi:hypothetical protein
VLCLPTMHTAEYVLTGEEAAVHGRRRVCAAVSGEVEFKANSRGGPHATVTGDWRLDDFSFPVRKSIIRSQYGRLPLRGCICTDTVLLLLLGLSDFLPGAVWGGDGNLVYEFIPERGSWGGESLGPRCYLYRWVFHPYVLVGNGLFEILRPIV